MEKKQAIRFCRQTNKKSGACQAALHNCHLNFGVLGRHNESNELGMRDPGQKGNPVGRWPVQNSNDFQR